MIMIKKDENILDEDESSGMKEKVACTKVIPMTYLVDPRQLHSSIHTKLHHKIVLHLESDLISVPVISHQQPRNIFIHR